MNQIVERFVFLNPLGILEVVVVSLLLVVVLYGVLKDIKRLASLRKKLTIISLRSASFLLILLILFKPALRVETYEETKPSLAVLVDGSWSMKLAGDEKGTPRIQAVRDFMENYKDFFSKIEESFHTSYYTFDESLRLASLESIRTNEPNGKSTDIGETIKELEKHYGSGELDSVILFSDGGDNGLLSREYESVQSDLKQTFPFGLNLPKKDSTQPGSTSGGVPNEDFLKGIGFSINTVAPLNDQVPDVWVEDVKVSEVAFVRYPLSVEVELKSHGFSDLTVPVVLKEGDEVVSTQEVYVGPQESRKAEFVLRPKSVGREVYTVSVPVLSGEVIKENNEKSFVVDVIIDKIRVLHVGGNPSWDVRFLRKVLKRNPNVDLVSFFILRDATDSVFASQNELSLIPFPVDEIFDRDLETFDIVIFHNFYFRPYGIYEYHLRNLKDYVEGGGAFVMVGGVNSFDGGSYGGTPISDIMPVELNPIPRMAWETFGKESFRAELTPIGENHPVMRIAPNAGENGVLWEKMPKLDGFNRVEGLKPHTLPLLVTPDGEPVLVLDEVGSGKVASLLSDSSWKWSFVRGGEGEVAPYYENFWNRLFLWLVNDPELKDVRISTERTSYSPGEKVELDVRVVRYENPEAVVQPQSSSDRKEWTDSRSEMLTDPGTTGGTANIGSGRIKATIISPSGEQKELKIMKKDADDFTSETGAEEYGVYQIKVASGENPDTTTEGTSDETVFLVEPPEEEVRGPNLNRDLLQTISEKTGGRSITVKDNPEKLGIDFSPKRIITGYKTVEIWNNPWLFLAILVLLSSEWMLRRRWGLR